MLRVVVDATTLDSRIKAVVELVEPLRTCFAERAASTKAMELEGIHNRV